MPLAGNLGRVALGPPWESRRLWKSANSDGDTIAYTLKPDPDNERPSAWLSFLVVLWRVCDGAVCAAAA